jgi:hypothetical protein
MATRNFFAPLRVTPMEGAEQYTEGSSSTPQDQEKLDKVRPPPIVFTSEANLISLQKELKSVVSREFFFRNTATGTRITTKNLADYKAIQTLLSNQGLNYFTFYIKSDKPIKAVVIHLPTNTSSEDITVALQELGYEVISVKQMTAKRPSPEGEATCISLPLFLVTLARSEKSQDIFKITSLCNIIVKVETYKSQKGLTQCYNCQRFGHIWVHCSQPPRCLWCGGGHRHRECPEKENPESTPNCCNCKLKEGEAHHPTSYRGCSHAKEEMEHRKNQRETNQGTAGRTFVSKYTTPDRSFASALHSSMQPQEQRPQQQQNKPAVHHEQQATSQASGQSVQAKNVNSNAMDDMFVAFTMVQQPLQKPTLASSSRRGVTSYDSSGLHLKVL